MQDNRPIVLSIAGLDPCAGAGVLADIKTLEQLKVYGMSVITANTIQTEDAFIHIEWQNTELVLQAIDTLLLRYEIDVFKIGIVPDFDFLYTVLKRIKHNNSNAIIIWDPVIKSTTGFEFFKQSDLQKINQIEQYIYLITPNYHEYLILKPHLHNKSKLFIKGGHHKELMGIDILQEAQSEKHYFPTTNKIYQKHGSGCILSTAIAAHLALGHSLDLACKQAKQYIERYLNSHPTLLGYHHAE